MTAWQIAWFAGALAVAAAVPGPAVMATVGRVLARGERGALAFCIGLVLGDLLWLWTATLGLGAAANVFGPLLRWGELAGAAYLLVLAARMWRTTPSIEEPTTGRRDRGALLSAFALQLGNLKAVLFYAALLPALLPLEALRTAHLLVLSVVVAIVIFGVNTGYVKGAALARRYLRSPRALRIVYRVNAAVLAATAIAVVVAALRGGA